MEANASDAISDLLATPAAVMPGQSRTPVKAAKRSKKSVLTLEEMQQRKRMLQQLERYPHLWRIHPDDTRRGRHGNKYNSEWGVIARMAVGDPTSHENAKQMKRWYQGIKSSIKYRIKSAESQGRLSAQLLQENYQEAIRMLYHHHPYEYWHQAEYLTKHCLLHAFDVDIDGIWTGPPGEGQRAILQNAGIQQPPPYGQMPHIPRSGNIDFPDQPGPSAQDFADRAEVSAVLNAIKQEQSDSDRVAEAGGDQEQSMETGDDPFRTIKKEPGTFTDYVEQPGPRENPLQHLLPPQTSDVTVLDNHFKKLQEGLPPAPYPAEFYGISEEEMQNRFRTFAEFLRKLEVLLARPGNSRFKFLRLLPMVGALVSYMRERGMSPTEIMAVVERKIANFELANPEFQKE